MFCDIVFCSFQENGKEEYTTYQSKINLKYYSIRDWYALLAVLEKLNLKRLTTVFIRPIDDNSYL